MTANREDHPMSTEHPIIQSYIRGRKRKRSERITKAIAGILVNALTSLIGGFYLMIAVGIAHAEWLPNLPTIGYWWAVLLVVLLRPAFATISTRKDDDR